MVSILAAISIIFSYRYTCGRADSGRRLEPSAATGGTLGWLRLAGFPPHQVVQHIPSHDTRTAFLLLRILTRIFARVPGHRRVSPMTLQRPGKRASSDLKSVCVPSSKHLLGKALVAGSSRWGSRISSTRVRPVFTYTTGLMASRSWYSPSPLGNALLQMRTIGVGVPIRRACPGCV